MQPFTSRCANGNEVSYRVLHFTRCSVFGRDKALCRTLEQDPFVQGHPRWLHEIIAMKHREEKCEIQAVYEALRDDFSHWLLEMVCCAITSDREEERT